MRNAIRAAIFLVLALFVAEMLLVAVTARAGASFTFECAHPSGAPVTGCDVHADPDFHNGDPGTLLFHATTAGKRTITLPDSYGRIVVIAHARTSAGTNSSVIVQSSDATACPTG